jgi:hypothetical protein
MYSRPGITCSFGQALASQSDIGSAPDPIEQDGQRIYLLFQL